MNIFNFFIDIKTNKELLEQYKEINAKQKEQIQLLKGWISLSDLDKKSYEERIKFQESKIKQYVTLIISYQISSY